MIEALCGPSKDANILQLLPGLSDGIGIGRIPVVRAMCFKTTNDVFARRLYYRALR